MKNRVGMKAGKDNLDSYLSSEREKINRELDKLIPSVDEYPQVLYQAVRHSVFAGGKRLRPILTVAAADGFNFNHELIYPTGCAIEMIHTYSLIHDDLPALDNDDLRRGMPTCHKVYGEAIAILAGDTLNTMAFGVLSELPLPDGKENIGLQLIHELSSYAGTGGMVRGQVVDVISEGEKIDTATLDFIHRNKTAALIVYSLRAGALLSDADNDSLRLLTELGWLIGMAFQVKDDILDITSTTGELGKTAGKDIEQVKATYPALYGLEKAQEKLQELTENALNISKKFANNASWLYYIVEYLLERRN